MTYYDVLPSIPSCSVERWTGFGTVSPQLLKMSSRRNRSSVEPNKEESTKGHLGGIKTIKGPNKVHVS
jgi:hypothetical protein